MPTDDRSDQAQPETRAEPNPETSDVFTDGLSGTVDPHWVTTVIGAIGDRDRPLLRSLLADRHPADVADLIEELSEERIRLAVNLAPDMFTGEVLAELDGEVCAIVIAQLDAKRLAQATRELDSDDATYVLESLDETMRAAVLEQLPARDRVAVEQGLACDAETAGRLLQREFIAGAQFWTVGDMIDFLRAAKDDDLPDLFFEIYVVDEAFRPVGAVPVSALVRSSRDTRLESLMSPPQVLIRPEMDQEDAAYFFQKYHLPAAPVVDDAGRLTGVLTIDDMLDVVRDEGGEDLLALANVGEARAKDTVARSVRARAPWLFVNLGTAICASIVIALFAETIERAVSLAILMPIVAALGGNAGAQALAVAVRALAARELSDQTAGRAVFREAATGLINGVMLAGALSVIAWVWFDDERIAGVIAAAMVINLFVAGLAGVLVPLGLKKAGADPAVASSVFVLTATDMTGFFVFLGLARLALGAG
ncbi:MAG: magnesium transporter [Maricaulaceae bacterium]